jgi:20S proteasome alpha/beta subunit
MSEFVGRLSRRAQLGDMSSVDCVTHGLLSRGSAVDCLRDRWCDSQCTEGAIGSDVARGVATMTVGIAALCEGGRTAVMAADRGIVFGAPELRSEKDSPKIVLSSNRNLILFSGNFPDLDFVTRKLGTVLDGPLFDVLSHLGAACDERCNEFRDRELRKIGASLAQLGAAAITQERKSAIATEMQEKAFVGTFLVAGVDGDRAYIYSVNDSSPSSHDLTGYHAIGTGTFGALPLLAARGMSRAMTLDQAAYLVYEAKRVAESYRGIGPKTDIAVVGIERAAQFLSESTIENLREIYDRRNRIDGIRIDGIPEPIAATAEVAASRESNSQGTTSNGEVKH